MDLVAEESIYVAGHGILCILQITVLLIFIIKTSRNKYYVIQKLGLSSVSLYTASTFILLCHHIFTLALQDEASQTILNGQIFRASGYLLVKFAEWNMLLIFLSRLHYTFNQTGLQISKKSKTFLYTLLGLVIINILIIIASMAIGFHFNGYWGLLYAGACIWCISYVILCITLVKRFIIRMDRIMISRYGMFLCIHR